MEMYLLCKQCTAQFACAPSAAVQLVCISNAMLPRVRAEFMYAGTAEWRGEQQYGEQQRIPNQLTGLCKSSACAPLRVHLHIYMSLCTGLRERPCARVCVSSRSSNSRVENTRSVAIPGGVFFVLVIPLIYS